MQNMQIVSPKQKIICDKKISKKNKIQTIVSKKIFTFVPEFIRRILLKMIRHVM